jgi:hypothetical protein
MYWIFFGGLGAIFAASIFISTIAYKRQQAIRHLKSQTRQLKRKIEEFAEIRNALLKTDPDIELTLIIQQQIIKLCDKLNALDPTNEQSQKTCENERLRHTQLTNGERDQPASQSLSSDTEIESVNIHINTLTKFLNSAYKKGRIGQSKYTALIHHLQRLKLDIDVTSHTAQANKYLDSGDRVLAQSHLKQAKEALRSSPLEYPEKTQQIRDLTEQIKQVMRSVIDHESPSPPAPSKPAEEPLKKKF